MSINDSVKSAKIRSQYINGKWTFSIKYNHNFFSTLTEKGQQGTIFHEYMHAYLYTQGASEEYGGNHANFINDYLFIDGINKIFPGLTDAEYNALRYLGCDDVIPKGDKTRIREIIDTYIFK